MEDDDDEIGDKRMLNKMKDKKRHRSAPKKETLECSKESFKKMKDEIDELRRNEVERAVELEDLRRKIENRGAERSMNEVEYALNFDKNAYLERGFIESAKWIKNVLAKTMLEEMSRKEFKHKFESLMIEKKYSTHIGMRSCARFNRGEECNLGRWHTTHKPGSLWTAKHQAHQQKGQEHEQERRNEMRLHVCTLCLETLGAAFGHSVLNCPWILKKNWVIMN